jgi:hypothetical protein
MARALGRSFPRALIHFTGVIRQTIDGKERANGGIE